MKKNTLIFLIICIFCDNLLSQSQNPNNLLRNVLKKLQIAKDYSVEANIKVDLPFINMLPINAKIYTKQPDKFKVESKSIAIVPRQGFDQIAKILKDTTQFSAVTQGEEMIEKSKTTIVNIFSQVDTSDLILGKLWIDVQQNIILKSQLTTRSNGTILTEYEYGSQIAYGLPDKMTFTVDIKKFKVPKMIAALTSSKKKQGDTAEEKRRKIFIKLQNYQVNKGIKDEIFVKEKQ